jgi:hypothetical protein
VPHLYDEDVGDNEIWRRGGDLNPRLSGTLILQGKIAFTTASFQIERVKRREVLRSAKKPKKWRKTVARSSPSGKFSFFDSAGRRELREPQCAM